MLSDISKHTQETMYFMRALRGEDPAEELKCADCGGTGRDDCGADDDDPDEEKCDICHGAGKVELTEDQVCDLGCTHKKGTIVDCVECDGDGYVDSDDDDHNEGGDDCETCDGAGVVTLAMHPADEWTLRSLMSDG